MTNGPQPTFGLGRAPHVDHFAYKCLFDQGQPPSQVKGPPAELFELPQRGVSYSVEGIKGEPSKGGLTQDEPSTRG